MRTRRGVILLLAALVALGLAAGCEKRGEITGTDGTDPNPNDDLGPPDSLAVDRISEPLLADGVDAATIHVTVVDARGQGLPGVRVRFTTTHGTIAPVALTGATGDASVILTSAASVTDLTAVIRAELGAQGRGSLRPRVATVRLSRGPLPGSSVPKTVAGSGREAPAGVTLGAWSLSSLVDEIQIPMLGVTLTARADPAAIPADGVSASRVTGTLMETTRRVPIAGRDLLFGASGGVITGRVQTDASGAAIATLTAAREAQVATITIFYGAGLTASTNVSMNPLLLGLDTEGPALIADGSSSMAVIADLSDTRGNPVAGARIEFSTSLGSITSPATTGPDGRAYTILVAGRESGIARVTARFAGSLEISTDLLFVEPPSTAALLLGLEEISLPADGASVTVLAATALDGNSNRVSDGTAVTFGIESGDGRIIGPLAVTQGGVARATYVAGTAAGTVTIRASSGTAVATATLSLTPLSGVALDLNAGETTLLADGLSATEIAAVLTDQFGHPVAEGTHVEFVTTLGTLEAVQPTDAAGKATALLRSERFVTGVARVTATAGGVQKTIDLHFTSEAAEHIEAVRVDPPRIGVLGAGDRENATITFEARDRNGIPVDLGHAIELSLEVLPMAGATDATVHPLTVTTNDKGRAGVTVNSGSMSGVVEVHATAGSISSRPVRVAIHGGLLDPDHFTIFFEKLNVAGLVYDGIQTHVTGKLGDVHGNPVPDSTAVWFAADFGIVQGSAFTDPVGDAVLIAQTGRPRPLIPGGDGLVRICAHSVNRYAEPDSICGYMMWSGPTIVEVTDPPAGFDVANGGSVGITYRVHDANDNPLTGGTSIVVTTTGGQLGGSINVLLPDTQSRDYTTFSVTLSDEDAELDIPVTVTVSVAVTSVNGNREASISGIMH